MAAGEGDERVRPEGEGRQETRRTADAATVSRLAEPVDVLAFHDGAHGVTPNPHSRVRNVRKS
jgi:hypothetical protein